MGEGTLSWLSPIGWAQQIRPYAGDRWLVALAPLALLMVLVAAMVPAPGESPGEWWANTGHRFPADGPGEVSGINLTVNGACGPSGLDSTSTPKCARPVSPCPAAARA